MDNQIISFFAFCAPAIIVGLVAYYFFNLYVKNEENRRIFHLHKENQKMALPLRLQAYERMTLFLERISPQQLLLRIPPRNLTKNDYENLLVNTIDEEFEHNMSQQIYLSDALWNVIKAAKSATIQIIRKAAHDEKITDTGKMAEQIFTDFVGKSTPSSSALGMLKDEVRKFLR